MSDIAVGDIVTMVKSGSKAKVMRLDKGQVGDAEGAELAFLDDIVHAKKHGLPFTSRAWVWFPSGEFFK